MSGLTMPLVYWPSSAIPLQCQQFHWEEGILSNQCHNPEERVL